MPDPYEIIGVRRDASLDEIRIAYRRSAQVLHPDRFATASDGVRAEAAHRMLQLNSAMEEIEDERADEASGTGTLGHVDFSSRPPATTPSAPPRPFADRAAATGTAPATTPARVPAEQAPAARAATPESEELVVATPPPTPAPVAPMPPVERTSPPLSPPPPAEPFVPPRPPDPAPHTYTLGAERSFGYDDDDDDDDVVSEPDVYIRPTRRNSRPSRIPIAIVGVVALIAVAVIAGYFVLRGGGSSSQTFAKAGAPFSFKYPDTFRARRLDGGIALNRPTYQVGFGIDENNYLLASTYKLGFTVQDDGSATGPKGQQLTPNQIDHDIDVTIAKLAQQAGFKQRSVVSGSLGQLRARIYDYAKPDGSLTSTFVVALRGNTEYYVTCQSSPRGAARITKACDKLLSSFAPA